MPSTLSLNRGSSLICKSPITKVNVDYFCQFTTFSVVTHSRKPIDCLKNSKKISRFTITFPKYLNTFKWTSKKGGVVQLIQGGAPISDPIHGGATQITLFETKELNHLKVLPNLWAWRKNVLYINPKPREHSNSNLVIGS